MVMDKKKIAILSGLSTASLALLVSCSDSTSPVSEFSDNAYLSSAEMTGESSSAADDGFGEIIRCQNPLHAVRKPGFNRNHSQPGITVTFPDGENHITFLP